MKLIPFTLLAATAGVATHLYLRQRRQGGQGAGAWTGMPAAGASSASMDSDLPGAAGAWPEAEQRLQDENTAGSPGGLAMATSRDISQEDDLFDSSSQRGEEPAGRGLADFTRGA